MPSTVYFEGAMRCRFRRATGSGFAAWLLLAPMYAFADPGTAGSSDDLLDRPCTRERQTSCTSEPSLSSGSIFLDEDFLQLIGPRSDRNYTLGFGIDFSGRWVHGAHLDLPGRWLDRATGVASLRDLMVDDGGATGHSAGIHLAAFTPQEIGRVDPIHTDRPFASIIALTARRLAVDRARRTAVQSEVSLGILGIPGAARDVQTAIHTFGRNHGLFNRENPQGWEHQISNGGEPSLRYAATMWRTLSPEELRWLDFAANGEAALGWYTGLAAGLQLRVGWLSSPSWTAPASPLRNVQQVMSTSRIPVEIQEPKNSCEAYLFATGRLRLVAYNALLHGQFRHSDVRIDLADISPMIEEVDLGASVKLWRVRFSYAILSFRTPEFRVPGGEPARVHAWGGIYVGIESE